MRTVIKKAASTFAATFIAFFGILLTPAPSQAVVEPVVPDAYSCATTTFPGGQDDIAFQLNLPYSLKLGDTEYQNVYASTNGLLTFGAPDGNFSSYPTTPSISLAGYDWVTFGEGTYLRYGTTSNSLCIQWALRPYPQSTGPITHITLLVDRYSNGTWSGQILTDGWLPVDLRRGIRFEPTQDVVLIDSTFQVGAGGVPIETQTCWDGSVIPTTQSCPAIPEPTLQTREVQCSWTNPYTQEVVYGTGTQQYYLYWDNSTVNIQTVAESCALVTPPTFIPPDPVENQRVVQCSWTNPYTQEVVNGTAIQSYFTYWDGSTTNINTVTEACAGETPIFQVPLPTIEQRTVGCSWTNPYTQEVVTGSVTSHYYLYWDGRTENIDDSAVLCADASPVFIEPDPELKERTVQCTWRNPYTLQNVYGEATAKYNLYWNGSESYVVSPEAACAVSTPVFVPTTYPSDSISITANEGAKLEYTAPVGKRIKEILFASYGTSENYQYGTCHAENSLTQVEAAVSNNTLVINADNGVFGDPCGGTYKYLSVVLTIEDDPNYVAPPTVECWDGSMVYELSECPSIPPPPPTYECWDGSTVSDLSQCPPSPPSVECWDGTKVYKESECPAKPVDPTPTPEPTPEPTPNPEPTPEPTPEEEKQEDVSSVADEATSDGVITEAETQAVIDNLLSDGELSTSEVTDLVESLQSDGQLSEEEKQLVSDVIVEAYADTAIPADVFTESGLDYEDLPPDQPITLENGVVLIAEVADAIEIFEDPAELLATVFTDPSKALMAVANVGADLPAVVREAAQKVTVASVVVGQVVAGAALTLSRRP